MKNHYQIIGITLVFARCLWQALGPRWFGPLQCLMQRFNSQRTVLYNRLPTEIQEIELKLLILRPMRQVNKPAEAQQKGATAHRHLAGISMSIIIIKFL